MPSKDEKLNRFIELLKNIFELDKADLDFGIYRIMNMRRGEIEKFFKVGLPQKLQEALAPFAVDRGTITARIAEIEKLCDTVGQEVSKSKMADEYQSLKSQLAAGLDLAAVETSVYSALYKFFSRYYDEGDFISKRRYKEGVYAIPYEGEEVKLHWANADQYYIKTAENFRDYTFVDDGKKVHFRLVEATAERNNNKEAKDSKREFMLYTETDDRPGVKTIEEVDGELIVRFIYDVPEDKKRNHAEENLAAISGAIQKNFPGWRRLFAPAPSPKNEARTTLEKHLTAYVAKNTFDYFIHKDLRGFLTRELDFFIKSEVIHLDDLDTTDAKRAGVILAKVRAVKRIGRIIIDFLAQIEDFQKKLWLKRKFVVAANWCVTLDRVDEAFYPEIIANAAQIAEWADMYAIDETGGNLAAAGYSDPPTADFLRRNGSLVIDTRHFTADFKDRLIASLDNLDERTDGLMIHSENFQALSLLRERYREQIKCVYIDPPYNTDATPIIYKNGYKESSWISLMHNRLNLSKFFLNLQQGYFSIAIDDYEVHNLYQLMSFELAHMELFQVIVNHYPGSGTGRSNVSKTHEYNIFAIPKETDILRWKIKEGGERVRGFCRSGTGDNNYRRGRPNSFYAVLVNPQKHTIEGFENPPVLGEPYPTEMTKEGLLRVYPLGSDGSERCWSVSYESAWKYFEDGMLECSDNNIIKRLYFDESDRELLPSLWLDKKFSAVVNGTNLLKDILGSSELFSFPKSVYTVQTAIEAGTFNDKNATILDYFAGSGTTGHAVLNLNRADDGKRKYILVEMGEYFNTVTLPRLKKVIYSADWKNGKPQNRDKGVSHLMKYLVLESYEDALSNIQLDDDKHRLKGFLGDDYMLRYMFEAEAKDSMLPLDAFAAPFGYKLKINEHNETKNKTVDLCETFAWLLGLSVRRWLAPAYFRAAPDPEGEYENAVKLEQDKDGEHGFRQMEGRLPDGRRALVIWRTITQDLILSNAALDAWFARHRINPADREFDVIYVNGDNNLENLRLDAENWEVRRIEPVFKAKMFEEA